VFEVAAGLADVAVADQVPVPSPFWLWMLNVPPLTVPFLVTFAEPAFTQVMVIDVIEPTYVPLHVDLLFDPSSVHPVSVMEAEAVVTGPATAPELTQLERTAVIV